MAKKSDITAAGFNPSNDAMVDEIKARINHVSELLHELPVSRRRSIALTHLETASMFAVKSVFYPD